MSNGNGNSTSGFKIGGNGNGNGGSRGRRGERTYVDDLAYVGVTALVTASLYVLGDYLEAWMKIRKIEKAAADQNPNNQQSAAQAA